MTKRIAKKQYVAPVFTVISGCTTVLLDVSNPSARIGTQGSSGTATTVLPGDDQVGVNPFDGDAINESTGAKPLGTTW